MIVCMGQEKKPSYFMQDCVPVAECLTNKHILLCDAKP